MIQFDTHSHAVFQAAFEFGKRQVRQLVEQYPGFYPMYTLHGRWKHEGEVWTHWCEGFLPGMLWIIYAREQPGTAEARWWREQAIRYTTPLEPRKLDREVHDLGFLFMCSYYRWYQLTKDPGVKNVIIEAGRTMALRFREKGQYLRSFLAPESVFIDIMMNVGIIFYAAIETGDQSLMDIAVRHAMTSRRVLIRGDGSTAHEAIFDLETGEVLRQTTLQGYRGDSCWSRGLTWALYGFGACYGYTSEPRFLQTAEACAAYYIERTPAGGVPPWDYDAPPETPELVDTSAAAIAASGFFQLSRLSPDPLKAQLYHSTARHILLSLCQKHLAKDDPEWEGILKSGVYHRARNLGVNESVMWGEYFFLEALATALSNKT